MTLILISFCQLLIIFIIPWMKVLKTVVLWDISKAFDKDWLKGLGFNLESFLASIKQRVLYCQQLSQSEVHTGALQGLIIGPLLFLIYDFLLISYLSDSLQCNPKLFASVTSLFSMLRNINSFRRRSLSYRKQYTNLQSKQIDRFPCNRDLRHERVKKQLKI